MSKSYFSLKQIIVGLLFVFALVGFTTTNVMAKQAEDDPDDYSFEENGNGTAAVTAYKGEGGDIVIPSTIEIDDEELKVTDIKGSAFYNSDIDSVVFPETLKTIYGGGMYYGAFENNNIKKLVIPKSVTNIGADSTMTRTFYNNPLEEVVIYGNPHIDTSLTPANPFVAEGDSGYDITFYQPYMEDSDLHNLVERLAKNDVKSNNYEYIAYDDINDKETKLAKYVSTKKEANIPETIMGKTVTTIKENAFNSTDSQFDITNSKVEKVTLPNTVHTIEDKAFQRAYINEINLPESLETIGDNAFQFNNLNSIDIPDSVSELGEYAFSHNEFKKAVIPDFLNEVPVGLFWDNEIKELNLPDHIKAVGNGAFDENELNSITLPEQIDKSGIESFGDNHLDKTTVYNKDLKFSDDVYKGQTTQKTYVYGYKGSTAESYADKYDYLIFVALDENNEDEEETETGNVTVSYVNQDGEEIANKQVLEGKVGDKFETEQADIKGYEFDKVNGNEEGKFSDSNITVEYVYNKTKTDDEIKKGKVTVTFVNENGANIADEQIFKGEIDDKYKTEKADIDGYDFVKVNGDAEGVFSEEGSEVEYVYSKAEEPDNDNSDNNNNNNDHNGDNDDETKTIVEKKEPSIDKTVIKETKPEKEVIHHTNTKTIEKEPAKETVLAPKPNANGQSKTINNYYITNNNTTDEADVHKHNNIDKTCDTTEKVIEEPYIPFWVFLVMAIMLGSFVGLLFANDSKEKKKEKLEKQLKDERDNSQENDQSDQSYNNDEH